MAATERTTKEVVDDTRTHLKELVDAHRQLGQAEMNRAVQQVIAGALPGIIGGVLVLYVTGFFAVTAAKGLDNYVTEGWAWLIVSVGVTFVALVLLLISQRLLSNLETTGEAQESMQETIAWAKSKVGRDT